MRHLLAFLVAPLWVPLIVELYAVGVPGPGPPQASLVVFMAVIAAFFAYAGAIIIGIPAYLILRWRNWTALWMAAAVGFVAGIVMWAVFGFVFVAILGGWRKAAASVLDLSLNDQLFSLAFALIGTLVATTAWLIIRPHREGAAE